MNPRPAQHRKLAAHCGHVDAPGLMSERCVMVALRDLVDSLFPSVNSSVNLAVISMCLCGDALSPDLISRCEVSHLVKSSWSWLHAPPKLMGSPAVALGCMSLPLLSCCPCSQQIPVQIPSWVVWGIPVNLFVTIFLHLLHCDNSSILVFYVCTKLLPTLCF